MEKTIMYFTVSAASKEGVKHFLVKAESAISALQYVQETKKIPVIGVHVTEYNEYLEIPS